MRRSPLQELPLDQFIPSNADGSSRLVSKPIRSNKRPLSPGGPILFSPAKRRILTAEGIFLPEKSIKSPLSSLREGYTSSGRFSDVLASPGSPARVLDFGLPKNLTGDPRKSSLSTTASGDTTPTKQQSRHKLLAPSPELKPKNSPRDLRPTNALSNHPTFHGPAPHLPNTYASDILIPRDLPPQSDPCSIHYPGFVVFQDPHIIAYSYEPPQDPMSPMDIDDDSLKENTWLRPKATKMSTAPGALESSKFKPASGTPRRTASSAITSSPRRKLSVEMDDMLSTPQDKKKRRQLLKDELDFDENCNHD